MVLAEQKYFFNGLLIVRPIPSPVNELFVSNNHSLQFEVSTNQLKIIKMTVKTLSSSQDRKLAVTRNRNGSKYERSQVDLLLS